MPEPLYIYCWGNNKNAVGRHRLQYKGRKCRVLVWGKMNQSLIEFIDTGELVNTSRNALRKAK